MRYIALALLMSCAFVNAALAERWIDVKYRPTRIDVDKPYFEFLDTANSSLVQGAWYDQQRQYMIINLAGTNYHYCGLTPSVWIAFKRASSFGSTYQYLIKGNFDCRTKVVPEYPVTDRSKS